LCSYQPVDEDLSLLKSDAVYGGRYSPIFEETFSFHLQTERCNRLFLNDISTEINSVSTLHIKQNFSEGISKPIRILFTDISLLRFEVCTFRI
jgi:hypothetical protein